MDKNNKIVNSEDIDNLVLLDSTFAMILDLYGSPPNWQRPQGFVSLSLMILEQQVSLASAKAHFDKLHGYIKDFTPTNILKLSDEEMRACQISRQKSKYLRALSSTIVDDGLDLDKMASMHEEEVRKKLTDIKGVGQWTADVYLMFCLQSRDIFPIGDIALVNTAKELYDVQSKEDILQLSENWKPYRSLASYFFWYYYLRKRNRPIHT